MNVAFEMATLEWLLTLWEQIPENERKNYSGVMGRSCLPNGQILGRRFPCDPFVSSYINFHYISGSKYGSFGDCCEFICSDLVKQFRFPEYAGEKFLVESYVTDQIGMEYKLYCTNAMQDCDGLLPVFAARQK